MTDYFYNLDEGTAFCFMIVITVLRRVWHNKMTFVAAAGTASFRATDNDAKDKERVETKVVALHDAVSAIVPQNKRVLITQQTGADCIVIRC